MNITEISKEIKAIHQYIDKKQLKNAIDGVKKLVALQQNWSVSEKLTELETNYRYMLHYLIEGKDDPRQKEIYDKLFRDIYSIADDAAEHLLRQTEKTIFFEKLKNLDETTATSINRIRETIAGQTDTLSFIGLLEEGEEKEMRVRSNRAKHEKSVQELFDQVFISPRANIDLIESLSRIMADKLIRVEDKSILVSALTMNIIQRFDAEKVILLLDICRHPEPETAIRAVIGIIPIFQIYRNRWHLYPECTARFKLLSDDRLFSQRFINTLLRFIQARETEKIGKKLTEEIIPKMMQLSPMIGKKISFDEWMGESGIDEKNPDWQNILDESGLTDKLQELSELQLEGADLFHTTFSGLKEYPFFWEMSNWFLPFDTSHSTISPLFENGKENFQLIETLLHSSMICNSDKYSFCLSIITMKEDLRKMMLTQFEAEESEIKKMEEEEEMLNPHQKENSLIQQYIQDLYRFFKLNPRHIEFIDIFSLPLNYHEISEFHPVVLDRNNLEQIALYYFEKNYFKEAHTAYEMLTKLGSAKSEHWQKIGFCREMMTDIKGALEAYLHADLIEENNSWLLNRIAYCYRVLKEADTALEYYRRLEQFRPDDLNIQLNIGHCYLELKQYDKAINYYFKVELIDSNNRRAWRSIAWSAFLSRKFDIAQKYYDQIIDTKPNADDYLNAGHVELCLKNRAKTVEFYRLSQQKTGSFTTFQNMLYDDLEELKEAGVDSDIIPIILDRLRYDLSE